MLHRSVELAAAYISNDLTETIGPEKDIHEISADDRDVLFKTSVPLAAIQQHYDTSGYSEAVSIRIPHNAQYTVILIVSFALIVVAVCFDLSR
jgi:hypothetical protein